MKHFHTFFLPLLILPILLLTACSQKTAVVDLSGLTAEDMLDNGELVFPCLTWEDTQADVEDMLGITLSPFQEHTELGLQETSKIEASLLGYSGTLEITFLDGTLYLLRYTFEPENAQQALAHLTDDLNAVIGPCQPLKEDTAGCIVNSLWSCDGNMYQNTLINLFTQNAEKSNVPVAEADSLVLIWNRSFE